MNGVFVTDPRQVLQSLLPFCAIGAFIVIIGIVKFFNKTFVTASMMDLRFFVAPLWLGKEKVIAFHEIANFSVNRRVHQSKNNRSYHHHVDVVLKNGTKVKLCSTKDMNESLFIERELEKFYNLQDNKDLDVVAN